MCFLRNWKDSKNLEELKKLGSHIKILSFKYLVKQSSTEIAKNNFK